MTISDFTSVCPRFHPLEVWVLLKESHELLQGFIASMGLEASFKTQCWHIITLGVILKLR